MLDIHSPIHFATRYTRSINLERDFSSSHVGVHDYQATPLAIQLLKRVSDGLNPESTTRAFSIIGPYGAGKSAFAVFLAHYIQANPQQRRRLLEAHATDGIPLEMTYDAPRLLPLIISGDNTSLRTSLLKALLNLFTSNSFLNDKRLKLLKTITSALDEGSSPQHIAHILRQTNALVQERSSFQGLAIFIDELGQFLDYAAREDNEQELFVLQAIAEMVARSGKNPSIIVTILHQAFDRYVATSGLERQTEWSKVQGRFIEIPFQESPVQIMRIVARALCPDTDTDPFFQQRQLWADQTAPITETLGLRPPEIMANEWKSLLARAYPLHPTVLVALPLLFRQLAQNERSLFAFLTSPEPYSVLDILAHNDSNQHLPIYRLTHLYKYVFTNLGSSLFARARGQRWAELAEAQIQLGDVSHLTANTLTTIGTLGALGQTYGLRASLEQISFALCDTIDDSDVIEALDVLSNRKLITYRQHRDSYIIWEGSDIDIDGLFQSTRQQVGTKARLVNLLQQYAHVDPLTARRHSYITGSTRSFAVNYVDLEYVLANPPISHDLDGEILYMVLTDSGELSKAKEWAIHSDRNGEYQRIVVLPHHIRELRDLLLDVAALTYMLSEHPEFEHDRSARREVSSRLVEAQQILMHTINETYAPTRSRWFRRSQEVQVANAHAVDELLSQACNETYFATPYIWNELIVRKQLSTSTSKARRNLVEALLLHQDKELLGIEGYPPERAIYESVLRKGTIHRQDSDGNWYITKPTDPDSLRILPVWEAMENFLKQSGNEARPLSDLLQLMEKPPYGVKAGLTPLLFVLLYITYAGEIVLYERGNYAPIVDTALFDRLLARPESFAIRLSQVNGSRWAVYEYLAQTFAPQALNQLIQPALLNALLPLFRLFRSLPEYSKTTKRITQVAQDIRSALRTTKAPDELLFESLPQACGFNSFTLDEEVNAMRIEMFFLALDSGLEELKQAYPRLLDHIRERIIQAFGRRTDESRQAHIELSERYHAIANSVGDLQIRALGIRLETADVGSGWLESIATLVTKIPPNSWNDSDILRFENAISDLGRRFRVAEEIALTSQTIDPASSLLRIGVATSQGESSRVVRVSQQDTQMISLKEELSGVLERHAHLTKEQQTQVLAELLNPLLNDLEDVQIRNENS